MPIRQRGDKWQVDIFYGGKRYRETAENELEAKRLEEALLARLKAADTTASDAPGWTLKEAYDRVYASVWRGSKAERSAVGNATQVLEYFGKSLLLKDISTDAIDTWVEKMIAAGSSDSTINHKLAALSKLMSFAKVRGKLDTKPHIPRRKLAEGRIRYVTDAEESLMFGILSKWSQPDYIDMITVLLDTGLRVGEVQALEARDVDLTNKLLTSWVNKSDKPRSIPLTRRVQETLRTRLAVRPTGRLFPYSYAWIRNTWERMKAHLGMEGDGQFVPHCLRHTFASRLAQAGVSIAVIKELMGHKTISITMRYAHLCPSNLRAGVDLALENRRDSKAVTA